jgi:hypothetical protein
MQVLPIPDQAVVKTFFCFHIHCLLPFAIVFL